MSYLTESFPVQKDDFVTTFLTSKDVDGISMSEVYDERFLSV